MPYQITHANGTILVTLQDLTIDTTSTPLALVGREVVNYGEIIAQNFVYLLENFASPATQDLASGSPRNALSGQLWYHTTIPGGEPVEKLRVYNGRTGQWMTLNNLVVWPPVQENIGGPTPQIDPNNSKRPSASLTDVGDQWYDTVGNSLYYSKKAGQYYPDGQWSNDKSFSHAVFDSVPVWYNTATPYTSELPPSCPVDGDVWMSLPERQLWVFDSRFKSNISGYPGPQIADVNGTIINGASFPANVRRPMDIWVTGAAQNANFVGTQEQDLEKIPTGWVQIGPSSPRASWTYHKYDWIWSQEYDNNGNIVPTVPDNDGVLNGRRHHSLQIYIGDNTPSNEYATGQTPMPDSLQPKIVGAWTGEEFNVYYDLVNIEPLRDLQTYSSWAASNNYNNTNKDIEGNANWDIGLQFKKGLNLTHDAFLNGTSLNSVRLNNSPSDNFLGRTESNLEPAGISSTALNYPKSSQQVRLGIDSHRWARYYGGKSTGKQETFTYQTPGDNTTPRIQAEDNIAVDVLGNIKSYHLYPYADILDTTTGYDLGSGGIADSLDSRSLGSLNNIDNAGNRRWRKLWIQYIDIESFDSDILPRTDGSSSTSTPNQNGFNIGSAAVRWATGFFHNINTNWVSSPLISIDPTNTSLTLGSASNRWIKEYVNTIDVVNFTSNLIPATSNTYDLGSTLYLWNNTYFQHLNTVYVDSFLTPVANAAQDLGSTAYYWNNAYLNGLFANYMMGDLIPYNNNKSTPLQNLGSSTNVWLSLWVAHLNAEWVDSNLIPVNSDMSNQAIWPNGIPNLNLGSSTKPWNEAHIVHFYTSWVDTNLLPDNTDTSNSAFPKGAPTYSLGSTDKLWLKLWANKIFISDDGVECNLIPDAADTRTIGNSTNTFGDGFFSDLYVKDVNNEVANGPGPFGIHSNLSPTIDGYHHLAETETGFALGQPTRKWKIIYLHTLNTVECNSNLMPEVNNTYNIGAANNKWKMGYYDGLYVMPEPGYGVGITSTTIMPQPKVSGGVHDIGSGDNRWDKIWLDHIDVSDYGVDSNLIPNIDCTLPDSITNPEQITGTQPSGISGGWLLGDETNRWNSLFVRQIASGSNDLMVDATTSDPVGTPVALRPTFTDKIGLGTADYEWITTYTRDLSVSRYVLDSLIPINQSGGGNIGGSIDQNIGSSSNPWNVSYFRQLNVMAPSVISSTTDDTGVAGRLVPSGFSTDDPTSIVGTLGDVNKRWNALYVDILSGGYVDASHRADIWFIGNDISDTGDVVPAIDLQYDLGKNGADPNNPRYVNLQTPRRWRNIWAGAITCNTLTILQDFDMDCNKIINVQQLLPCLTTASYLGGPSIVSGDAEYWSYLYVQTIYGRNGTDANPANRYLSISSLLQVDGGIDLLTGDLTMGTESSPGNIDNCGNIIPAVSSGGSNVCNAAKQSLGDPSHYWQSIYVCNIYTGPATINGPLDLTCNPINNSGTIIPCAKSDLGSSADVWANLYISNINNIQGSSSDLTTHKVINGDSKHNGTFYPEVAPGGSSPTNAIYDLGTPDNYWNKLYCNQIISPNNSLDLNCNDIVQSGNIIPCTSKTLGDQADPWATTYTNDLKVNRVTGPVTAGSYMIDFTGNGINSLGSLIPNQNQTVGNAANHWSFVYTDALSTTSGTVYGNWTLAAGATWQATYADLAERYEADDNLSAGTVVILGGEKEVSASDEDASIDVFGVVATNPAYLLNAVAGSNETHPPIAKIGRIPCRVIGTVKKGDRLCSSHVKGVARAMTKEETRNPMMYLAIIGRALENKDTDNEDIMLITVGKN